MTNNELVPAGRRQVVRLITNWCQVGDAKLQRLITNWGQVGDAKLERLITNWCQVGDARLKRLITNWCQVGVAKLRRLITNWCQLGDARLRLPISPMDFLAQLAACLLVKNIQFRYVKTPEASSWRAQREQVPCHTSTLKR